MNYERMSNRKLFQLVQSRMPGIYITGVDGKNRCTVIAFLKVSDDMGATTSRRICKRPAKAV